MPKTRRSEYYKCCIDHCDELPITKTLLPHTGKISVVYEIGNLLGCKAVPTGLVRRSIEYLNPLDDVNNLTHIGRAGEAIFLQ